MGHLSMITDSSKNYLDGWVTLVFDGVTPTITEINEYCQRNYSFTPKSIDIDEPREGFGGYPNPGIVKCII